jgi:hypothetical protein
MVTLSVVMAIAMAMKITTHVQKIVTLLVNVMMDSYQIVLMTANAGQRHGLVMATAMVLPKSGVLTYVAMTMMAETAPKQSVLRAEILLQMVLHLLKMQ